MFFFGLASANVLIVHCSMLAEDAIKSAIKNYYSKNPNVKPTNLSGTEVKLDTAEPAAAVA